MGTQIREGEEKIFVGRVEVGGWGGGEETTLRYTVTTRMSLHSDGQQRKSF